MREFSLCRELSMKLAKDLGATPFSFGKTSLTHSDLLTKISLNVVGENDEGQSELKKVPMWYGEANGSNGIVCCLLAGLDTYPDSLEFACVLGFKDGTGIFQPDETRLSVHLDWANDEDSGTMAMKVGDIWIPIDLAQRLQLVLGFEVMVQDGILWRESQDIPELLLHDLTEIIEVDEKSI